MIVMNGFIYAFAWHKHTNYVTMWKCVHKNDIKCNGRAATPRDYEVSMVGAEMAPHCHPTDDLQIEKHRVMAVIREKFFAIESVEVNEIMRREMLAAYVGEVMKTLLPEVRAAMPTMEVIRINLSIIRKVI
jgi:hypothetical protein